VTTTLRVAAIQMTSGSDPRTNLIQATELVNEAAHQGARYIQLPEYASFWGPASQYVEGAQRVDGPFVSAMADLATELGVTVHVGSILEATDTDRYANASVVLGPAGDRAIYRKTHLFDVDVPNGVTFHESKLIDPGHEVVTVRNGATTLGLSVCFDLRFPELFRALALADATVLCVPSAFSAATGPAHWEVLLRARAIENGAFVVAAAQVGATSEGLATHGHAMIIDPWGVILAEAMSAGPEVVVADCGLTSALERRQQINTLGLRRPSLYAGVVRRYDLN